MKKVLTKKHYKVHCIASLILILSFAFAHAQIITTVAGSGTTGYTGDGAAATAAGLYYPTGVFVDNIGNIYIADQLHNAVRMVDTSGIITTVAGNGIPGDIGDGGAATSTELNWPIGLFVDAKGNVYISENTGNRVRKVNTSGIITTIAGNGNTGYSGDGGPATSATLSRPSSLSMDNAGNMYIADWQDNAIRKVDTSGIITTVAGTGTAGFSGDGGPADSAQLNWSFGVYVNSSGNIYIADWNNNRIRMVDTAGIITTVAGNGTAGYYGDNGPATAAKLNGPCGVWGDAAGNIYIADQFNNVVRMMDTSGIITTIAGNDTAGYSGDGGLATLAEIYKPTCTFIDGLGNIYIADQYNDRVRKITYANAVPPVASFQSSETVFCANNCINFKNLSANATSWQWSFSGATPSSSTDQNPQQICYPAAGGFAVTLVASNSAGTDTLKLANFITVYAAPPTPAITQSQDTLFCSTDPSYTSYQWYADSVLITGGTDTFYVAPVSGNYNVQISNENGCSVAVGINVFITGILSSSFNEEQGFILFPNPANELLAVGGWQLTGKTATIEFYNLLGQKISDSQLPASNFRLPATIDVSGFAKGVYFLQLTTENEVCRAKLVKE